LLTDALKSALPADWKPGDPLPAGVTVSAKYADPVAQKDRLDDVASQSWRKMTEGAKAGSGDVFSGLSSDDRLGLSIESVADGETNHGHQSVGDGSVTKVKGRFGTLNLRADGTWTYQVDRTNPVVRSYGARPNLLYDVFTVKATTASGDATEVTIPIEVWKQVNTGSVVA
jgi:VCBS repeat-containing protein